MWSTGVYGQCGGCFPPSTDIPHGCFSAPPVPVTQVIANPCHPRRSEAEIGDGMRLSIALPEIAKRLSGRRVAIARGLTRLPDRG